MWYSLQNEPLAPCSPLNFRFLKCHSSKYVTIDYKVSTTKGHLIMQKAIPLSCVTGVVRQTDWLYCFFSLNCPQRRRGGNPSISSWLIGAATRACPCPNPGFAFLQTDWCGLKHFQGQLLGQTEAWSWILAVPQQLSFGSWSGSAIQLLESDVLIAK